MPGRINEAGTDNNQMSPFMLLKAGVTAAAAADPTVDANVVEIDIEQSNIGFGNMIVVALERTAGSVGSVNIAMYRKFATPSTQCSIQGWKPVVPDITGPYADASTNYVEVMYTGLMPGTYRMVFTAVASGDTWNAHVSHNVTKLSRAGNFR